jgi:OmpA family protein
VNNSLDTHLIEGSLIGSLPLTSDAGVYARAGVDKWWSTIKVSFENSSQSFGDNGTNGLYGAGIYEHFDAVACRIEWTRSNVQDTKMNRFAIAAYWRF